MLKLPEQMVLVALTGATAGHPAGQAGVLITKVGDEQPLAFVKVMVRVPAAAPEAAV